MLADLLGIPGCVECPRTPGGKELLRQPATTQLGDDANTVFGNQTPRTPQTPQTPQSLVTLRKQTQPDGGSRTAIPRIPTAVGRGEQLNQGTECLSHTP